MRFASSEVQRKKKMQPTNIVYGSEVNSSDAFVPPKPNEFDKTALIGIFFEAVKGMKASLNMISGLVRLSVNGATPCNGTQAT
nr:hypothetical protein CFP56_31430 [Quercus suber]